MLLIIAIVKIKPPPPNRAEGADKSTPLTLIVLAGLRPPQLGDDQLDCLFGHGAYHVGLYVLGELRFGEDDHGGVRNPVPSHRGLG